MSYPFGDLLSQFLHRKHGLSQAKLAEGILQPPVIISMMCKGQRLTGPQARERVVEIIRWLHRQHVLTTLTEANALLAAAGMANLDAGQPREASLRDSLIEAVPVQTPGIDPAMTKPALARRTNLPAQLTSFVGREREVADLLRLLGANRLVTVTGAGGCGKTRLALHVAAQLLDQYVDGVWLVELAPLADPGLIAQRIATVLGMREEAGQPILTSMIDVLRSKHLMLLLDNCEHVIDACAYVVAQLLGACPHVSVLTTSREALALPGEITYRLAPLPWPDPDAELPLDTVTQYDAVRLFLDRAMRVQPDFSLTSANAAAIVQICQRVDGIPLALELVAARIAGMRVEHLAAQLEQRFWVLTGSSRAVLPRQQTVRTSLDWSYDLLSPVEQAIARRLAVFAGGWSLEASEAVCTPDPDVPDDIFEVLLHLVDTSLVEPDRQSSDPRYRMLEVIRHYLNEKLVDAGEAESIRERHLAYYLRFAEEGTNTRQGADAAHWLTHFELERDNLRAALEWATHHHPDTGLRLANALWPFWEARGYWREGLTWLETLLTYTQDAPAQQRGKALMAAARAACALGQIEQTQVFAEEGLLLIRQGVNVQDLVEALYSLGVLTRYLGDLERTTTFTEECMQLARQTGLRTHLARALAERGMLADNQGDFGNARFFLEESLAIWREVDNTQEIAATLRPLGYGALFQGDYARARRLWEESLALWRDVGNATGTAELLGDLGYLARTEGDSEQAVALLEESLTLCRTLEIKPRMALILAWFGRALLDQGALERAASCCEESVALYRQLGIKREYAVALVHLSSVMRAQGDYERAGRLLREALAINQQIGDKRGIIDCLEGVAALAIEFEQPGRAAQLWGAAAELRKKTDLPMAPADQAGHSQAVAAVHDHLGVADFTEAWTEGQAMSLEQAIAAAQEILQPNAVREMP